MLRAFFLMGLVGHNRLLRFFGGRAAFYATSTTRERWFKSHR
jgi:hypothetical protein